MEAKKTKEKIRKNAEILAPRPKPGTFERDQTWIKGNHV
jgi:hypothetical protein